MTKILVVDDEISTVDMLQTLLSANGYQVSTAENGKAGLEAAREEKPDLILLDVMMPVMDGFTVSGLLFQDPVMRLIPVIILSAMERPRNSLDLLPNIRLYMTKPFDAEILLQNIETLLAYTSKTA